MRTVEGSLVRPRARAVTTTSEPAVPSAKIAPFTPLISSAPPPGTVPLHSKPSAGSPAWANACAGDTASRPSASPAAYDRARRRPLLPVAGPPLHPFVLVIVIIIILLLVASVDGSCDLVPARTAAPLGSHPLANHPLANRSSLFPFPLHA